MDTVEKLVKLYLNEYYHLTKHINIHVKKIINEKKKKS
jgi:hypothetical protein